MCLAPFERSAGQDSEPQRAIRYGPGTTAALRQSSCGIELATLNCHKSIQHADASLTVLSVPANPELVITCRGVRAAIALFCLFLARSAV